ncbi:MAG TPA: ATPase, partial [Gemmatales bacterium]|nr:ATPase [Gemmatales bacterium]
MPGRHTILCLATYFKGNRFIERAKREGCHVILLTDEKMLDEDWALESIDELFALPSYENRRHVVNAVAYLYRTRPIDRLVALDDYDVELGAFLREFFHLPGMGETVLRAFRDKLAMRYRARDLGVLVPEFVPCFNDADVRSFIEMVPGPWLIKPRSEASAIGIKKLAGPEDVWAELERRGDDRAVCLIEKMVPGDLFHVDSIVANGRVAFCQVSRYHKPLLDVYHGGGVFMSRTVPMDSPDAVALAALNERLLIGLGLESCASHTEFMKAYEDGQFYFIETSARVGGADISEMVEQATGVNLWEEWAKVEIDRDLAYEAPRRRELHAGVIVSLARTEWPDTSRFNDPEIAHRLHKENHIGFVVASENSQRIDELL